MRLQDHPDQGSHPVTISSTGSANKPDAHPLSPTHSTDGETEATGAEEGSVGVRTQSWPVGIHPLLLSAPGTSLQLVPDHHGL